MVRRETSGSGAPWPLASFWVLTSYYAAQVLIVGGWLRGQTVAQATKQIGVTDKTYFRWRKSHGGLRIDQAKRLRDLEAENARLKKAVAVLTVDKIILKEVAEGKF